MASLIARLRRPVAFLPLLLLLGVVALKVVAGLGGDDDEGTKGVDQSANGEEYVDFGAAPPVAPNAPGASGGAGQPGAPASTAGPGFVGGAPQLGGSGVRVPNSTARPDSGSGGSGGGSGSGSGSGSGGGTSPSFTPTKPPRQTPTPNPSGSPTPTPTPTPTPSPTPTGPPPVNPDYNRNGEVDLNEAQRYCREEKHLNLLDSGWAQCVNQTATV